MAVLGRLAVDRAGQVELLDDDARPHVEVALDDLDELVRGAVRRAVRLDEHRQRLGDTNGVRQLHQRPPRQLRMHERFGDPPRQIGRRPVDFGVVFAREGPAAMRAPAAVGVNDDLAPGETGVALGTANDEETRRLDLCG